MNIFQDLLQKYKSGNVAVKFIFIAVVIAFGLNLVDFLFFRESRGFLYSFLSLPSSFWSFIKFPLSLFIYVFVPKGIFNLIFTLMAFYYVSNLFLTYFREKDFLTFFFLGAIGSGILFLVLGFFLDSSSMSGFTPVLFCLLFGVIAYQPKTNVRLFFISVSFQLQYIGYFFLGLEMLVWLSRMSDYSPLVNVGSAALGYFYMKQFEIGNDFLGNWLEKLKFNKTKPKTIFDQKPPRDDYEYQDYKAEKQKRLDEILEKISAEGYDSLTKDEKEFLFKASK